MAQGPFRRIVTGHNAQGKAIIDDDKLLQPFDPFSDNGGSPHSGREGFINLWKTDSFPAKVLGPWEEYNGKRMSLADEVGTTARIVDFVPGGKPLMHRTISLDFGLVLEGEIVMELDDGVETTLKQHDMAVQRGTIHAWKNVSDKHARMFFVLLPSEKINIGGQELEATAIPGDPNKH